MSAKQKLTVYIPEHIFNELKLEAERQDRSVSWMIEHCWQLSRRQIQAYPSVKQLVEQSVAGQ